jgi:hypothetical protein
MECVICHETIRPNEVVLMTVPIVYLGPSQDDVMHQASLDDFFVVVHRECLDSPTGAATSPGEPPVDVVVEESIVQRTDALSLFD